MILPRGFGLADWLMAWVGPLCLLGLLEAGGVTAEKIQVETDIGEEGGIECTGVELWFAYPSQEERALALLRGVLGEELSIRTQTGGG